MKKTIVAFLGLIALTIATAPTPAAAVDGTPSMAGAYIQTVGLTSIPVGHAEYCGRHVADCAPNSASSEMVTLTPELWDELQLVNNSFNAAITPARDIDLYGVDEFWTYPVNGYGDCEDFVIAKRAALIELGWDASVLLITVVRQADGEGHAVLTVRTDRGDLVLDNQDGLIQLWADTPYTFLKRQSQALAGQWVDLIDPRGGILVAQR